MYVIVSVALLSHLLAVVCLLQEVTKFEKKQYSCQKRVHTIPV